MRIRPRRLYYTAISAIVLLMSSAASLSATMIVVVKVKDGFWIGSDSKRLIGGGRSTSVCKVHPTSFGFIGKDGNIEGFERSGARYSTDKELRDLLHGSKNEEDFKAKLLAKYSADVWDELAHGLEAPDVTPDRIAGQLFETPIPEIDSKEMDRSVVLVSSAGGVVTINHLLVVPTSIAVPHGFHYRVGSPQSPSLPQWLRLDGEVYRDPSELKHPSLRQFGIYVKYNRDEVWIQAHPKEAIEEVLRLATADPSSSVGPPYSIIHAKLSKGRAKGRGNPSSFKITTISKGKCPGWTDSLSQP